MSNPTGSNVRVVVDNHPSTGARNARVEPFHISDVPSVVDVPLGLEAEPLLRSTFPNLLEIRAGPHQPSVARVAKLETLIEALRDAPVAAIEYTLYSLAFEQWVGDVLGDADLRREIAGIRASSKFGEDLRTILFTIIHARYSTLAVRRRV